MNKYLKILEFDKIIENVSKYCKTYIGIENAKNIVPSFNKTTVSNSLNQTSEAISLLNRKGPIPLSSIPNVEKYIKSLESENTLSAKALLDIAKFLQISREVKNYFSLDDNFDTSSFYHLDDLFSSIYTNKNIEDKIFAVILDENTISDDASPKLAGLRKQTKKLEIN